MLFQPLLDLGVLVRRVVVADEMKRLVLRGFAVDLTQEVEPLNMAVTLRAAGDHRTIKRTHRGKQGRRPMALVVVGHRFRP